MQRHATRFLIRWLVSTLGLFIAAALLGSEHLSLGHSWRTTIIAGLILALINMFIKPILVFLSIPAILITLGLFMLVVNGTIIWLTGQLYDKLYVASFGWAIVAGIIIGLVNYLVSRVLEDL
jgi:putative membrane protein